MNQTGVSRNIFKRLFSLLVLLVLFNTGVLNAQPGSRVVIPGRTISVSDLIKEIERQTGYIVLNNNDLNTSSRLNVLNQETTVDEIMKGLLSGTGKDFRINDRYIVLFNTGQQSGVPAQYSSVGVQPGAVNNAFVQQSGSQVGIQQPLSTTGSDGSVAYPSQSRVPRVTRRNVSSPFLNNTPPMFGIKTNLLYGAATLTPNLGGEIGLGKKTTLEFSGGINKWNQDGSFEDNKKLVHWFLKPEFRYWLCERFNGHFFGLHAFYGQYNIGGYDIPIVDFEKEFRYEGDAIGGGISYGYHWIWGKRWGMEFNIGVGVAYLDYTKSDCDKCSPPLGEYTKTYFGPTSAGIKLVYLIK